MKHIALLILVFAYSVPVAGQNALTPANGAESWINCDDVGCGRLTWWQMTQRAVQDFTPRGVEILDREREAPVTVALNSAGCVFPAGGGLVAEGLNANTNFSPRTFYNVEYDVPAGVNRVKISLGLDGRIRGNPDTSAAGSTSILNTAMWAWQGASMPTTPTQANWVVGAGIAINSLWGRGYTEQLFDVNDAENLKIRVDVFHTPSGSPLWVAANVMGCRPRLTITPLAL